MKIAVCDDQQSSLRHVLTQVSSVAPRAEVSSFSSIPDLIHIIEDGVKFDAVLIDIEWDGEQKGIDYAAEIYKLSPQTSIIFVTGYPECYSQQIFLKTINLAGFVSKPIDAAILSKNLEKIEDGMAARQNRKLVLRFNGVITSIDPDDILYIESRARTSTVYSTDGSYLCYEKLVDLTKRLPGHFVLTHKSFLVNMDKIRRIDREFVLLEQSMEVPVSKSRLNGIREYYFQYIGSRI